jgi:hypothetical protein
MIGAPAGVAVFGFAARKDLPSLNVICFLSIAPGQVRPPEDAETTAMIRVIAVKSRMSKK